ncbi:MAG: hypothetical protein V3S48_05565 [Candidatus Neomarinimicrobiota bacterium]
MPKFSLIKTTKLNRRYEPQNLSLDLSLCRTIVHLRSGILN